MKHEYKAQLLYEQLKQNKESWELIKPSSQQEWKTYLDEHHEKYDKVKKMFHEEYEQNHKHCPKCGDTRYNATLMGAIFNMDNMSDYKDRNTCTCSLCGDRHLFHERVNSNS